MDLSQKRWWRRQETACFSFTHYVLIRSDRRHRRVIVLEILPSQFNNYLTRIAFTGSLSIMIHLDTKKKGACMGPEVSWETFSISAPISLLSCISEFETGYYEGVRRPFFRETLNRRSLESQTNKMAKAFFLTRRDR